MFTFTKSDVLKLDNFNLLLIKLTLVFSIIPNSLAIPKWLKQSPLFGVISKSNILSSLRFKASIIFFPALRLSLNIIIPSLSSFIPNSFPEQTIPFEYTSLILAFLILKSPIFDPIIATGTVNPFLILGAPQIISSILFPKSILHNFNLSALGCLTHFKTLPMTTSEKLFLRL